MGVRDIMFDFSSRTIAFIKKNTLAFIFEGKGKIIISVKKNELYRNTSDIIYFKEKRYSYF